MSAECDKHGVDLHGDTFSGLVCPVCEVEAQRDEAEAALEQEHTMFEGQYRTKLDQLEAELEQVKAERDTLIQWRERGEAAEIDLEHLRSELEHLQKVAADRRYSDEFVGNLARSTLADLSPKDRDG